jgi:hypothetical protein
MKTSQLQGIQVEPGCIFLLHMCMIFLGHQAWVFMTKPDMALKRPCSSAGLIIATQKNPANSKPFRLNTGSQKPRAAQEQAKAAYLAVLLLLELLLHKRKTVRC